MEKEADKEKNQKDISKDNEKLLAKFLTKSFGKESDERLANFISIIFIAIIVIFTLLEFAYIGEIVPTFKIGSTNIVILNICAWIFALSGGLTIYFTISHYLKEKITIGNYLKSLLIPATYFFGTLIMLALIFRTTPVLDNEGSGYGGFMIFFSLFILIALIITNLIIYFKKKDLAEGNTKKGNSKKEEKEEKPGKNTSVTKYY